MKQRALYILKTYGLTVIIFVLAKLAFMLCNGGSSATGNGSSVTLSDVFAVIVHGLSLDLSTALYILIVPFLCTIASLFCGIHKVLRIILLIYHALISLALALAFVADTSLYPFWHFKLDASCLQYLETPTEAMASVSIIYLIVRLVVFLLVALLFFIAYQATVRSLQTHSLLPADRKSAAYGLLVSVLLIPLIVIGIRGGLGESTTNIGQVYFSQNQFLNHSAVNPVFSFLSSFEKTASYVPDYDFMSEEERSSLMTDLYPTKSVDSDTLLRTRQPNIVVILLESCGGVFTEAIGKRKDVMPRLNQLTHEGIYFANFYANSYRTDRGTLCTWSGYPSFPRSSVMKMPAKTEKLPGIAATLRKQGYTTSYLYGGDINFTNMRGYLINVGFEHLHWQKDYSQAEQNTAKWGVRDDITFKTLSSMVKEQSAQERPFLIGYSTLSSHEPWDVPTHRLDDPVLNAFNYLDECIGQFIDDLRQTPQWDNLLVILLPDHGFTFGEVSEEHPMHDHVPMLWLGGGIQEPKRVETICNQTDLAATLLGQMGLDHSDFRFSRDILSKNYQYPFAIHTYNNGITMCDSTGFAVLDLNANKIVTDQSTDAKKLIQTGKAILQTAAKDLKEM